MEFAQSFRRFGSTVTVVEPGARLAGREDPDVGDALRDLMIDESIAVALGSAVVAVKGRLGERVTVHLQTPEGERTVTGSHVLIAAGRTPNTAGIGLERVGVACDERGFVVVNDRLEMSAADTWAIGDCAGRPQFTHASQDDFRVIRDNWNGGARSTSDRLIPSCLYTDPPLARIGLSVAEAERQGKAVRVATLPVRNVLRARTISETRGFMQAVVETEGDRMFGPDAGEVLAAVLTAMLAGLPYTGLRDAVLAHPIMAEGLNTLFTRVPAR